MKPLSELVKEWRLDSEKLSGDANLVNQGCADELEAWLREADAFVEENSGYFAADAIKRLLGTTQKPKQEEER